MRLVPVLPNIAPSNVGEQESHNQHHRRAHTSFRLNLSLEDEERSPSFDDDMELQLLRKPIAMKVTPPKRETTS